MRTSVAALLAIPVFFLGITAISESAQQTQPALNSTSANASYNLSVGVYEGIGQAGASSIPWFGVGAVVLVALGVLVVAGASGGR